MSSPSGEYQSTSPSAPADESQQHLRLLETQLVERECELEALRQNAEHADREATRRLTVVQSELLELREHVRLMEQRVWTRSAVYERVAQASERVAPRGTLRGQVMGYALSTMAMAARGALRAAAKATAPPLTEGASAGGASNGALAGGTSVAGAGAAAENASHLRHHPRVQRGTQQYAVPHRSSGERGHTDLPQLRDDRRGRRIRPTVRSR